MSNMKIRLNTRKLDELLEIPDSGKFVIQDGVEYGIYQEFSTAAGGRPQKGGRGTTGKGHPSLLPAFERETRILPKLVQEAFKNQLSLRRIIRSIAFRIQRGWAGDVNVDTGTYRNSIHVTEE